VVVDAVIRVYDEAGNVIETRDQAAEFKEARLVRITSGKRWKRLFGFGDKTMTARWNLNLSNFAGVCSMLSADCRMAKCKEQK
jgi:hypothetical protein